MMVKPGDALLYRAEVSACNETGGKTKASALCRNAAVTTTEMVFAFKYLQDPLLDVKRQRLMELWSPQ
jgi:hypothetical protein